MSSGVGDIAGVMLHMDDSDTQVAEAACQVRVAEYCEVCCELGWRFPCQYVMTPPGDLLSVQHVSGTRVYLHALLRQLCIMHATLV